MKKPTHEQVEACIEEEQYHQFPGTTVMVCLIKLKGGLTVSGGSSCIDPADFNLDTGKRIAREKAVAKAFIFVSYKLSTEENS